MDIQIAAAQTASVAGDVAGNVERHLRFARVAAGHGVQLLVFPELSLTGYELGLARGCILGPESVAVAPLRELARRTGMTIVAGAPVLDSRGLLCIGALVFGPDGSAAIHTKVHVHSSEAPFVEAGLGGPVLQVGATGVGLAICRDAKFAEHADGAAADGARVYAVGALVDGPSYDEKFALLQGHARRNGMAVLLANYSGSSGGLVSAGKSVLFGDDGAVLACAGEEECLVVGTGKAAGVVTV